MCCCCKIHDSIQSVDCLGGICAQQSLIDFFPSLPCHPAVSGQSCHTALDQSTSGRGTCSTPSGLSKQCCLLVQGFAFQCLSSRLGIATSLNLAQHCGKEYPRLPRYLMWICMEIAIIGADIQEVIGSAIAIALLSNNVIPLWAGKQARSRHKHGNLPVSAQSCTAIKWWCRYHFLSW